MVLYTENVIFSIQVINFGLFNVLKILKNAIRTTVFELEDIIYITQGSPNEIKI